MSIEIEAAGLADFARFVRAAPGIAKSAASRALNQTMERKALKLAREKMRAEIAFPTGYLEDPDRFGMSRFSTPDNLEAGIKGRQRPTSLARFSIGGAIGGRGGVPVRVGAAGGGGTMRRAFLLPLRAGTTLTDTVRNLGLAVRLRPGETIEHKRISIAKPIGPEGQGGSQLYLLYGPSIDQVFRTVAVDISPQVLIDLEQEFVRQFAVMSGV